MPLKHIIFFSVVGAGFLFLSVGIVFAFTGPSSEPGYGSGAIFVDGAGRLGIGTTNPGALLHLGFVSSTAPELRMTYDQSGNYFSQKFINGSTFSLGHTGSSILTILTSGNIGINTPAPSSTLHVVGSTRASAGFFGSGANISELNMSNAVGSTFSSASYAFPLSLAVGTSTRINLPQTLSVYGGGYFRDSVGIGISTPPDKLSISGGNVKIFPNGRLTIDKGAAGSSGGGYFEFVNGSPGIVLGITDNSDSNHIVFKTRPSDNTERERMRITAMGNVGIGTSTPAYKLSVEGPIYSTGSSTASAFCLGGNCQTSWSSLGQWTTTSTGIFYNSGSVGIGTTAPGYPLSIVFSNSGTTQASYQGIVLGNTNSTANNGSALVFGYSGGSMNSHARIGAIYEDRTSNSEDTSLFFGTLGAGSYGERMRITSAGNVGVGTISPTGKIDIVVTPSNTIGNENASLKLTSSAGATIQWGIRMDTNNEGFAIDKRYGGIWDNALTITRQYGNVGIATTTPQAKLDVNGLIKMRSATITQPEDVVNKSYVDSYIPIWFSSSTPGGNLPIGTSGQTIRHNGTGWIANSLLYNDGTNVGIGTTNPGSKLDILDSSTGGTFVSIRNTSTGDAGIYIDGSNGDLSGLDYMWIGQKDSLLSEWNTGPNSGNIALMPKNGNGYVGIGTNAPGYKLEVAGSIGLWGAEGALRGLLTSNAATHDLQIFGGYNNNGGIDLQTTFGGTSYSRMYLANGGNVGIATTTPQSALDVNGLIKMRNATITQPEDVVNRGFADSAYAPIGGTSQWSTTSTGIYYNSGNVGIGTTVPSAKLHLSAAGNPTFWLSNTSMAAHPFTAVGFGPEINGTVVGAWVGATETGGGFQLNGFSNSTSLSAPVTINGHIGSTSPTVPAVRFVGYKSNGTTGRTTLADSEIVMQFANGSNQLVTLLGSGNVGIGTTNPDAKLYVQGAIKSQNASPSSPDSNVRRLINVASYQGGGTQRIGTLIIKLPSPLIHSMAKLKVSGWSYQKSWDLTVSGYLNPSNDYWNQIGGAVVTGNPPFNANDIRLVADSTTDSFYILLGNTSVNHGYYASVNVDVDSYYSNGLPTQGWDIYISATEPTITDTRIPQISFYGSSDALISGSIGVATTTPQSKLDVNGLIKMRNATITQPEDVVNRGFTDSAYAPIGGTSQWSTTSTGIYYNSGNVGIGTTTPTYKLDIAGGTNNILRISGSNTANIVFDSGSTNSWGVMNGYVNGGKFQITKGTVGSLPTSVVMTFDTNGNVGIGTTAPGAKLDVGGSTSVSSGVTLYTGITSNSDAINSLQLQNLSTGTSAEMRIMAAAADGSYMAFTQPSNANTGTFFGITKGLGSFLFNYGGNGTARDFYIGTIDNKTVNFATNNLVRATILGNGNVGIGTTTPSSKLHIFDGNNSMRVGDILGNSTMAIELNDSGPVQIQGYGDAMRLRTGSDDRVTILSGGNVGIATTTPQAKLDVYGLIKMRSATITQPEDVVNRGFTDSAYAPIGGTSQWSTTSTGIYYNGGNVGIGASPQAGIKLDIRSENVPGSSGITAYGYNGAGGMAIRGYGYAYEGTGTGNNYGIFGVSWGPRSIGTNIGGYFEASGASNNYALITGPGNVGIGTTAPLAKFSVGGDYNNTGAGGIMLDAYPAVSDVYSLRINPFVIGSGRVGYQFQTKSVNAGTYVPMTLYDNGNVGIGTTDPSAKLDIDGGTGIVADMSGGRITGVGNAIVTSDALSLGYANGLYAPLNVGSSSSIYVLKTGDTMTGSLAMGANINMNSNDIVGVDKLTVSTIDPVYTIDGKKYATYVSDSIGIKVHAYGKGKISGGGTYVIDFKKASRGSDEWLFWQTIHEGKDMNDIIVMLTPEGTPADLWYELKWDAKQIVIHSSKATKFSYQLTAPRHDAKEWSNILLNSEEKGMILPLK